MRKTKFHTGLLLAVLLTAAGLTTACRNNSPTNNSSGNNGTSNYVPMALSISNSINLYNIIQINIVDYPSGTTYLLPVSVTSGASTVYNFQIPAGVYTVNVYDNNNAYDGWSPVTLNSGTNDPLAVSGGGAAALNLTACNHCGI